MNNEPIVYWNGGKVSPSSDEDFLYPDEREAQLESLKRVGLNAKTQFDIPLYTAPEELTDEEIVKTMELTFGTLFIQEFQEELWEYTTNLLKKAQEK